MKRTLMNDGRDHEPQEFGMDDGESNSLDTMATKQRLSSGSECCTTFDWAELGSCLKRVKISVSSPGEIRLSTDLHHLTHQCGWSKNLYDLDNRRWYCYRHPTKHLVLTRDPVDFLRLKLVLYEEGGDECCFFIKFPRMYPHSAPEIYRLSSNLQKKQTGSQQAQTIDDTPDEGPTTHHAQTDDILHKYQYKDWTPIRRLHDIIEWLILLPHFPHNGEDEIMTDNEYPVGQIQKYHQEGSLCTDGNVKNNGAVNSTVEEQQPKQQHQGYSYSNTSLEIEKTHLWLFNQSRFDVGFVPLLPPSSLSTQSKEDIMM